MCYKDRTYRVLPTPIKEVLEEGRDPVHAVYDAIEDKVRKSETKTAAADTEPMCRTVAWLG